MPHGLPDFWQGTIAGMPTVASGQVPWYMSDAEIVDGLGTKDLINYVVPDTFELHVCSGTVSCDSPRLHRYDLRQTPAGTWVSPTSHSDPEGVVRWPERAYDGDLFTYCHITIQPVSWSEYFILLVNEAYIDKVRFKAYAFAEEIDKAGVDVWYEGAWHNVFEGIYADREWEEIDINAEAKLISKARFRFYNPLGDEAIWPLFEFEFNISGPTPQEGIYFDTQAIIPYIPQAPYIVEPKATFAVRMYNDDEDEHNMTVALAGFLQQRV